MLARVSSLAAHWPHATASAAGFVLSGAGDVVAQALEEQPHTSQTRALGQATYSAAAAIVYVQFFSALDRWSPGTSALSVAKKVAADNLAMGPFVGLPVYYAWTSAFAGHTPQEALDRAQRQYVPTMLGSWAIWVPGNALLFAFVPPHLRVPLGYTGEFTWSVMMSLVSRPARGDDDG